MPAFATLVALAAGLAVEQQADVALLAVKLLHDGGGARPGTAREIARSVRLVSGRNEMLRLSHSHGGNCRRKLQSPGNEEPAAPQDKEQNDSELRSLEIVPDAAGAGLVSYSIYLLPGRPAVLKFLIAEVGVIHLIKARA